MTRKELLNFFLLGLTTLASSTVKITMGLIHFRRQSDSIMVVKAFVELGSNVEIFIPKRRERSDNTLFTRKNYCCQGQPGYSDLDKESC